MKDLFGNELISQEEPVDKPVKINWLFDVFLPSINFSKENIMDSENESKYQPYMINHFLSGTIDSVLHANEMNCNSFLDKRLQYDYLRLAINKKKRYSKWLKQTKDGYLESVMKYYGYNITRAKEALNLLTEEQLKNIESSMDTGGIKK